MGYLHGPHQLLEQPPLTIILATVLLQQSPPKHNLATGYAEQTKQSKMQQKAYFMAPTASTHISSVQTWQKEVWWVMPCKQSTAAEGTATVWLFQP